MQTRRQLGIQLVGLSTLLALRGLPAQAADVTLRFGTISVEGSPTYTHLLEPFASTVERLSHGQVDVALKGAGSFGKPTDLLPMMDKGELDLVATTQGYYPGRFPQTTVLELPMMFDSAATGTKAINALLKEGLLSKDYASLKVVALSVTAPFSIFTTGKKIITLRDIRGLRVRTPGPTVGLALARLGAIPIGIPVSGIGDAIANGIVDAIAFNMDSVLGTKGAGNKLLAEQLSVVVDTRFAAPAQLLAMNQTTWDRLPSDVHAAIETAATTYISEGARWRDESEASARQKLQANPQYSYLPFSPQLHDEMQQAMAPVYDDWKADMTKRGIDGEALLTRARELVRQYTVASKS